MPPPRLATAPRATRSVRRPRRVVCEGPPNSFSSSPRRIGRHPRACTVRQLSGRASSERTCPPARVLASVSVDSGAPTRCSFSFLLTCRIGPAARLVLQGRIATQELGRNGGVAHIFWLYRAKHGTTFVRSRAKPRACVNRTRRYYEQPSGAPVAGRRSHKRPTDRVQRAPRQGKRAPKHGTNTRIRVLYQRLAMGASTWASSTPSFPCNLQVYKHARHTDARA